jgi:hypothetical protein
VHLTLIDDEVNTAEDGRTFSFGVKISQLE